MSSYKDLEVWVLAIKIVKYVYKLTEQFPDKERYRLTDQMCRAAVSIPSNIAEGSARKSDKEFMRFIAISLGSLAELRTQLFIGCELGYTNSKNIAEIEADCDILGKKLQALYAALSRKDQ